MGPRCQICSNTSINIINVHCSAVQLCRRSPGTTASLWARCIAIGPNALAWPLRSR